MDEDKLLADAGTVENQPTPANDSESVREPVAELETPVVPIGRGKRVIASLRRKYPFYLIGAEVVIFLVMRLVNIKELPIHIDESLYVGWGRFAAQGSLWLSMVDGKGPLQSWSMVPFLKIFSDPLRAGRMTSVFYGAIGLVAIVLIGKALKNWSLGAWVGLFWVLCPYILFYDKTAFVEGMLLGLLVLAVLFAIKAARTDKVIYFVLAGITMGLAMWTKGTAQLLFLLIPLTYLSRDAKPKEPAGKQHRSWWVRRPLLRWLILSVLTVLLGYGLYSLLRLSPNYEKMAARSTVMSRTIPQILKNPFNGLSANLHNIWNTLWSQVTPIVLLICLIGLVAGLVLKWRPVLFLWAWFAVTLIAVSLSARHPFGRYWTVLMPPLIIGAGYAVSELPPRLYRWLSVKGRPNLVKATGAVVMIVLAALLVVSIYSPSRAEVKFVRNPAASATESSWGYKIGEVAALLRQKSANQPIRVQSCNGFTQSMLDAYLMGAPNIYFENLGAKPKPGQEKMHVYVVGAGLSGMPTHVRLTDVHVYDHPGAPKDITVFGRMK